MKISGRQPEEDNNKAGIGIALGRIFTLGDAYGNCFRLNAAFWPERTEQALETLGGLVEGVA